MDIIYIWWPKETMLGVREVVKIEVKTLVKKKKKNLTKLIQIRVLATVVT